MYILSIPLPDVYKPLMEEAFASAFDYQAEVRNPDYDPEDPESPLMIPNPLDSEAFVQDRVSEWMLQVVKGYILRDAERAAYEAALADANNQEVELRAWFEYVRINGEEPPPGGMQSLNEAFEKRK
jgi:hypothetical protein